MLCRWQHRLKATAEDEAAARKQSLASAEELFIALLEAEEGEGQEDEASPEEAENRMILINLLALHLERKRVLRPARGRPGHHVYGPEKREIKVPRTELDPSKILPLLEDLDGLL